MGGRDMKGGLVVVAVLAVIVLVIGGMLVGGYNGLVQSRTTVETAWAQVENVLQRRNDLIPNLVETVKGIAQQEQAVFGAIADARARMAGAKTPEETIDAAHRMDTALGRLFVVVENYPQLKSSENFLRLQDEIAGSENRISVARGDYNAAVKDYNVKVQTFPTLLFARLMGFTPKPFFEATPGAEVPPHVQFNLNPRDTTKTK
jgi:LemA protein